MMKKRVAILLLLALFHGGAIAQPASVRDTAFRSSIEAAATIVQQTMKENFLPGFSICVGRNDTIIWAEGFGYATVETGQPVTTQTLFRTGSISKSFTGIMLMKMVQEGRIKLDVPATAYLPGFPKKKYPFTVRQLATHQAGIRHYNMQKMEFFSNIPYGSVTESLEPFRDDSLLFKPGSRFAYTTYGYVLLSACMENAAVKPFLTLMKTEMFDPMNMTRTVPDHADSFYLDEATPYDVQFGKFVKGVNVNNSNKWAGGGFLSTPSDIVLMSLRLLHGRFLDAPARTTLWMSSTLDKGDSTGYGIGFRIDYDSLGRKMVHHGGQPASGRAFLLIYPDEKLVIAMACNTGTTFNEGLAQRIAACFFRKP